MAGPRTLRLPVVGVQLTMPEAVYYAVLGALAAAQVVEPELALVIAAGHLVASRAHHPAVQEAGEAAEAA